MPQCKNDPKRYYKGDEPSPKGLGYCAHAERIGKLRKGLDNNQWIVSEDKNGRLSWKIQSRDSKSEQQKKKKPNSKKRSRSQSPFETKKKPKTSVVTRKRSSSSSSSSGKKSRAKSAETRKKSDTTRISRSQTPNKSEKVERSNKKRASSAKPLSKSITKKTTTSTKKRKSADDDIQYGEEYLKPKSRKRSRSSSYEKEVQKKKSGRKASSVRSNKRNLWSNVVRYIPPPTYFPRKVTNILFVEPVSYTQRTKINSGNPVKPFKVSESMGKILQKGVASRTLKKTEPYPANAYIFGKLYPLKDYTLLAKHKNIRGQTGLLDADFVNKTDKKHWDNIDQWERCFPDYDWDYEDGVSSIRISIPSVLWVGESAGGNEGMSLYAHRNYESKKIDSLIVDNHYYFDKYK